MSQAPAISCRGLVKTYDGVVALDGLDLIVERGAIVSLLGPSGCGKTTALRVIAGFEPADAGTVSVGDRIVFGNGIDVAADKRRVGMVFQDYALFPHMTVARNIAYGLDGRDPSRRVGAVLDLVGLSGFGDRMPNELSGGEQQRVALARALAPEPEIVLLDEPFSSLDAPQRDRMRREVRRILIDAAAEHDSVTHTHGSGVRSLEAGDDSECRCLSATRRTEEAHNCSSVDDEIEPVERDRAVVRLCETAARDGGGLAHTGTSFWRKTRKYIGTAEIASSTRAEAAASA